MTIRLKAFCVTFEKYPTFRVDLTELFSKGLIEKGYHIDWHMQSATESAATLLEESNNERVYLGAASSDKGGVSKIKNRLYSLLHTLKILKIVKSNNYDFVQVRDKPFAALIALIAARRENIPFFYWMSYPYPESDIFMSQDKEIQVSFYMRFAYRLRGIFSSLLLYKIVLPRADHVFVQSDQMLKDVAEKGISPEKMTPVPMGISLHQLAHLELPEINADKFKDKLPLVYVGTMVRVRRIDFLIEMIKLVKESYPQAILLLVGDAPEKDMELLRQAVMDYGVEDSVIFTGFIPMEEAWSYIKVSKVCLSPFRPSPILDSTTPTKVVEYLAMERPVVANTHPDQSKVLGESKAGYAVDYSPQAFADAVCKILADDKMAEEMGRRGFEYIKQHRSYESITDFLDGAYRELMVCKNKADCEK